MSPCVPCLAPRSPDPAPHCLAQVPGHSRSSKQPGSIREDAVSPTWLGLCACAARRAPGCSGQEQALVAQSPASPLNGALLPAPDHTVTDTVSAPGPQGADGPPGHRRCGSQCERAFQRSGNQKTNILFLWHASQPAHTQDRTCETTSLPGWSKENSLPNKSPGAFPKHTRALAGAKANVAGMHRVSGAAPTGAGLEGMEGHGFCPDAWSWVI